MAYSSDEEYETSHSESAFEVNHSGRRKIRSRRDSKIEPEGDSAANTGVARPSTILAEDPFGNSRSKLLFDAIDKLRDCGAGQDLDLPQLVIVGKQSAGKSSLLESLTEIPFPVGGRLCTRFATRIISRRTAPGTLDIVNVSIEQGDVDPFGDSGSDSRTANFKHSITAMTPEAFKDTVDQVSKVMGVVNEQGQVQKNFSSKVLKIELSGPNRSHFGILDVPGVFGNTTPGITMQELEGVKKMVVSYMEKPQNIMICVADASDDIANQTIFPLASEHVENDRIVGVFTKCDRTQSPEYTVQTVKDNEFTSGRPLKHGWFVVRNRGPNDDPLSFDRDATENAIFNRSPWVQISEQRRGTANLKTFLSNLLCRRIREGFPGMQDDVQKQLNAEFERQQALGKARISPNDQRGYLFDIVKSFAKLGTQALKAPGELQSDHMKLRGKIERVKDAFAKTLREEGHFYAFSDGSECETTARRPRRGLLRTAGSSSETSPRSNSGTGHWTIFDEIRAQILANQGEELQGMVNPAVLRPLLEKQASKWPGLAKKHLEDLADMTQDAVDGILRQACDELRAPEYTWEELDKIVTAFSIRAQKRAMKKLDTRWYEETVLHLQTNNPSFVENVKKSQLLRFKAALQRFQESHPLVIDSPSTERADWSHLPDDWDTWTVIRPDSIDALFNEMHPHTAKNTENEIHDLLKAYYEVALEEFISYVNRHIAEPFIQDKEGPLMGLSPEFIVSLSDEKVEELGGEDEMTVNERERIKATIARLEAAKKIANDTLRRTRGLVDYV